MAKELKFGIALICGLAVIYLIYSAAMTAGWQFDDRANLNRLSSISDNKALLQFIFSGNAGPLGRPLSLLTFGLQSPSWPNNPEDFLYVNILIHLLNGCLVAWLSLLLSESVYGRRELYPSLWATGIWLAMPLLASSNLMVVQRMATLSGTMTLLGLVVFTKLRLYPGLKDWSRALLCGAVIILFGGLSAAAKENGALFPIQCLAVEFLLSRNPRRRFGKLPSRVWRGIFLYIPTLAIVLYLLSMLPYSDRTVFARGFDGMGRLLYETQALIAYLFNGFIPRVGHIGPFHDEILIIKDFSFYLRASLATAFWIGVGWIAITKRSKYPELFFAYVWYLGSHLVESTTVPLELYFEHRNYIPMIGVAMSLAFFSFRFRDSIGGRLYYGLSTAYILMMTLLLYGQTTLWGNNFMSAVMWSHNNPASPRAMLNVVAVFEGEGAYDSASKVLDDYYLLTSDPRASFMKLIISCEKTGKINPDDMKIDFSHVIYKSGFNIWMSAAFEKLYILNQQRSCDGITQDRIYALGMRMLESPNINNSSVTRHNINGLLSAILINAGRFDEAKLRLRDALQASFNLDTLDVALRVAQHTRDQVMSDELWQTAEHRRPRNAMKRYLWDEGIRGLEMTHGRGHHEQ